MPATRKRGLAPLAASTRKRILRSMLLRADAGDLEAAEALVRLSLERDRAEQSSPGHATAQHQTAA